MQQRVMLLNDETVSEMKSEQKNVTSEASYVSFMWLYR